jgi:intracellular septation protein
MAQEKDVNPILKQVLELGPTLVFFLMYLRMRDNSYTILGTEYSGFIMATVAFVPVLLIAMGILWYLTGKLSRMQIFTAFMVIFFGGLTAYFNDERFFKMKTTLVYGFFAVILSIGLVQGKSYLAFVLSDALPMAQEGWMILTRRLTMMFAALAVGNEIIWRTMSTDAWVKIETFGFPILLFGVLWAQFAALQKYMDLED